MTTDLPLRLRWGVLDLDSGEWLAHGVTEAEARRVELMQCGAGVEAATLKLHANGEPQYTGDVDHAEAA